MFRLSQKADYGLILLSDLARSLHRYLARDTSEAKGVHTSKVEELRGVSQNRKLVSIAAIAKKHKISPKFLSKIASDLKRAGIITAREGAAGGYTLAKKPEEIKLLDVLKILEGELVEGKCFEEDHECVCGAGEMWQEVREQLSKTIGKKTVADLATTNRLTTND